MSSDSQPYTYVKGDALHFVDSDGMDWRVFDCARVNQRHLILPSASERTEYRVFVSRDGRKCVHVFGPRELKGTRTEHLDRQLRDSRELDIGDLDPAFEARV